jgi:hypothetical protein
VPTADSCTAATSFVAVATLITERPPEPSGSLGAAANRFYGLIIIIVPVVVPRSMMASVAEMKPHAWAEVHGYAGTVMSPIANVVINVTTVV